MKDTSMESVEWAEVVINVNSILKVQTYEDSSKSKPRPWTEEKVVSIFLLCITSNP